MKFKVVVYAPPYDPNVGGAIALHNLCHTINELGGEAYVFPVYRDYVLNRHKWGKALRRFVRRELLQSNAEFYVNRLFNTPVLSSMKELKRLDDYVAVYSDVFLGNPLEADHIVRWMLHDVGHHLGQFHFMSGELHYKYQSWIKDYELPGITKSKLELRLVYFPLELYSMKGAKPIEARQGVAYCVRKGKDKPQIHHPEDAILIDGKTHEEIAEIFKTVKMFLSYDTHTAYSKLAVLCGCVSVVIPDDGIPKESWHPEEKHRYGIAYGLDDLAYAEKTSHLVLPEMVKSHELNFDSVNSFLSEIGQHFFEKSNRNNGSYE